MNIITFNARHALPSAHPEFLAWEPSNRFTPPTLHMAAQRLASRCGVPFSVALAHAEAAGLGREAH